LSAGQTRQKSLAEIYREGSVHFSGGMVSLYPFREAMIRQGIFWAYETDKDGLIKIAGYGISE
jgi:hypothetical protein